MRYYCNQCKKTITKAEYSYSRRRYSRALCRKHQKSKKSSWSDIGDTVSKITKAFSKVYEKGGLGLTLLILGAVVLILSLVLKKSLGTKSLIAFVSIALALITTGSYILFKKETEGQKKG